MTQMMESTAISLDQLEETIARAMRKVHTKREADLCRYIPTSAGVYMHHFTLSKLKRRNPAQLALLLEKFILNAENPAVAPPKPRAARGARKQTAPLPFTRDQIEKMIHLARLTGDDEVVSLLSTRRSLQACKRELIASIRQERIEQPLWDEYVAVIKDLSFEGTSQ